MKNFKKSIVSGVCLLSILAGSSFGFAAPEENQKPASENFMDSANLAKKYYDLVVENANLQSEKTELKEEILNLKSENESLKKKYEKTLKKATRLKSKLEKKKGYMTKEEVQNEIEKVKFNMTLEFTKYLSEYVKNNPKKKLKHVDMKGFFSDFLTFNVNYTNKGDTNFTPLAVKGVAKGTLAGGAAVTK